MSRHGNLNSNARQKTKDKRQKTTLSGKNRDKGHESKCKKLNTTPTNSPPASENDGINYTELMKRGGVVCRSPTFVISPPTHETCIHLKGRVVVGGWVFSPAGQNRRTVGHCGRTKLLLHAHCFDTLGDPIKLNANAKMQGAFQWGKAR